MFWKKYESPARGETLCIRRYNELDSLRGFAAFSVLLSHFWATIPSFPSWVTTLLCGPLCIFVAGHEGVVFFFVLSGFVLALPFLGEEAPSYWGYLVKRVLRIYSPFLFAVGGAMFFRELLYNGPVDGVNEWFNRSWQEPVTWRVVITQLMLIGPGLHNEYDPVIWSLFHEMRISIIFPMLVFMVRVRGKMSAIFGVSLTLFCGVLIYLNSLHVLNVPNFIHTIQYIGAFICGALLAKHRNELIHLFAEKNRGWKYLLIVVSVFLYTNSQWLPQIMHVVDARAGVLFDQIVLQEFMTMMGVAIMIIASLSTEKISMFLALKPFKFLGSISYSLYLYQMT
ncbi:MAG: acyltransferase family protein [Chthoniobacteraceae bacterium]